MSGLHTYILIYWLSTGTSSIVFPDRESCENAFKIMVIELNSHEFNAPRFLHGVCVPEFVKEK